MKFSKLTWSMLPVLLSVASVAYAQDASLKHRQHAETAINKPVEAKQKLLDDAAALIKAGKPDLAYKLLEPFEFDRSGEERFDYLLGIAALDSGKPDKATLALERVLAEDSTNASARMDIARAYYQLGDMQRAKIEFGTVLDENPSDAARATIQKYLEDIAARENAKKTRISGYLDGTVGRDTNINNGSGFPSNIITPTLIPKNAKLADNYLGVAAGGEIKHDLNANIQLYAGADISKRNYILQNSYESFSTRERAGMIYGTGTDHYRIGVSGRQNKQGGASYYSSSGVNAEWRHAPDASRQFSLFGQYERYRYAQSTLQANDIDQIVAGVGMLNMLGNGKSALSGSLYVGTENDVGPATLLRPAGGRTDGAKHFLGLRVGGQAIVNPSAKLFLSAGEQVGRFSDVNPLISGYRLDRLGDLTVGMDWYLGKLWMVRPQLARYINTSNVGTYSYDRNDYSLTIRRYFK